MIAEDNKVKREETESKKTVVYAPKPVKVHPVIETLRSLDLENLTMKQSFDILANLKEQAL